jgi:hypothetical protein
VKPGLGAPILSTLLRYMPRIGPFKGLAFNNPTPQTEDLYIKSIDTTPDQYRDFLEAGSQRRRQNPPSRTMPTQNYWVRFDRTLPELRANVLDFYSNLSAPIDT